MIMTRAAIVERARATRAKIVALFQDAEYWNTHTRKPDEEPINPDPDGALTRILAGLDRLLAAEDAR